MESYLDTFYIINKILSFGLVEKNLIITLLLLIITNGVRVFVVVDSRIVPIMLNNENV